MCLVCIWKLIFTCCLGEDKTMRLYNEEESSWDKQRKERGRSLREIQPVENLRACQFQLVHSGLWTQQFYFPSPLRERPMFCHSALQLKLFPLCSWPFKVSQGANHLSKLWIFGTIAATFRTSCQTGQKQKDAKNYSFCFCTMAAGPRTKSVSDIWILPLTGVWLLYTIIPPSKWTNVLTSV